MSIQVLDDFLTCAELAAQLRRHERTLDRWHRLGTGPARTKIGNQILYKVSDVRAWLDGQRQEAPRARAAV